MHREVGDYTQWLIFHPRNAITFIGVVPHIGLKHNEMRL